MKNDMTDLKRLVNELMKKGVDAVHVNEDHARIIKNLYADSNADIEDRMTPPKQVFIPREEDGQQHIQDTEEFVEESLSLLDKEKELIMKALEKHHGKRKSASEDLGISERTLYRKIKEYDIDL